MGTKFYMVNGYKCASRELNFRAKTEVLASRIATELLGVPEWQGPVIADLIQNIIKSDLLS